MTSNRLLVRFISLLLITAGVYLSFSYLLPLVLPFVLSYLIIRSLMPVMQFLHNRCHFPKFLSHYGTLFVFYLLTLLLVYLIFTQILKQCRLLFTNLPIYQQILSHDFEENSLKLCCHMDNYFHFESGTTYQNICHAFSDLTDNSLSMLKKTTGKTLLSSIRLSLQFFRFLISMIIGMIILLGDFTSIHHVFRKSRFYPVMHQIFCNLRNSGMAYLKTESIIFLLNWGISSLALYLIKNPYSFLLGLLIAFLDALPMLGTGTVFFPWGLWYLLHGEYYAASVLFLGYVVTLLIREFFETHFLGNKMYISPFFMFAAILIGLELFGICGIFLGPFAVILIRSLYRIVLFPSP